MQRSSKAFTLIELLVVISIIALLISLLLPTLSKARVSARQVLCGTQERQVTLAITMYADDNDGWHPPVRSVFGNMLRQTSEHGSVRDYLNMPLKQTTSDAVGALLIFLCPSHDERLQTNYVNYGGSGDDTGTTYRIITGVGDRGGVGSPTNYQAASNNWYGWQGGFYTDPNYLGSKVPPLPKQELIGNRGASDYPAMADAFNNFGPTTLLVGSQYFGVPNQEALNNHPDGVNTSFVDGHVAWASSDKFVASYTNFVQFYSGSNGPEERVWW